MIWIALSTNGLKWYYQQLWNTHYFQVDMVHSPINKINYTMYVFWPQWIKEKISNYEISKNLLKGDQKDRTSETYGQILSHAIIIYQNNIIL